MTSPSVYMKTSLSLSLSAAHTVPGVSHSIQQTAWSQEEDASLPLIPQMLHCTMNINAKKCDSGSIIAPCRLDAVRFPAEHKRIHVLKFQNTVFILKYCFNFPFLPELQISVFDVHFLLSSCSPLMLNDSGSTHSMPKYNCTFSLEQVTCL